MKNKPVQQEEKGTGETPIQEEETECTECNYKGTNFTVCPECRGVQIVPVQEHKPESEENLKQLSNITTEEYITISNIYYGKNNGTWKQGYFIMKDFESGKIKCNWLTVVEIFNFLKIREYNLNTNIIALNSLIEDKNMEKDLFYKLVGMVGNWLTLEPKVAHEMYSEFKKQGFEITKKR